MSTFFERSLMVMRSLSLRTHAFTLCVITGTLFLCLGFFKEPNIDFSRTTTNVQKELDVASASDLTITVEVCSLSQCSDRDSNVISVNELTKPDTESQTGENSLTLDEYITLSKVVEAEAATEDVDGKTLIANVVFNRVDSSKFPEDILSVIYDPGQFDPVSNGYIDYCEPSHDAKVAVMNAAEGKDNSKGALYFQKSKSTEWGDKTFLFRYGNHTFYK